MNFLSYSFLWSVGDEACNLVVKGFTCKLVDSFRFLKKSSVCSSWKTTTICLCLLESALWPRKWNTVGGQCICKKCVEHEDGVRDEEGYNGMWSGPRNNSQVCLEIFLYFPLNRILVGIFGFFCPMEFKCTFQGQPVTVPQRCECPEFHKQQYCYIVGSELFNSLPPPHPIPIKRLLDPQRSPA